MSRCVGLKRRTKKKASLTVSLTDITVCSLKYLTSAHDYTVAKLYKSSHLMVKHHKTQYLSQEQHKNEKSTFLSEALWESQATKVLN